jgi:hypothetical protein
MSSSAKNVKPGVVSSDRKAKATDSRMSSSSGTSNATMSKDEDGHGDYEAGKRGSSKNRQEELDADRKAVADLDKWG